MKSPIVIFLTQTFLISIPLSNQTGKQNARKKRYFFIKEYGHSAQFAKKSS